MFIRDETQDCVTFYQALRQVKSDRIYGTTISSRKPQTIDYLFFFSRHDDQKTQARRQYLRDSIIGDPSLVTSSSIPSLSFSDDLLLL